MIKHKVFFFLNLLSLIICAQSSFETTFEFGINFYSANNDETFPEHKDLNTLNGHYDYRTKLYHSSSLVDDSVRIFNFIKGVNQQILGGKIDCYDRNFFVKNPIVKSKEPRSHFYQTDSVFMEDENGDLNAYAVHDTTDYSKMARIDILQEWFYNEKKNSITIENICFGPVIPMYSDNQKFKGFRNTYFRKQGEFSTLKNQKKATKSKNTIWAQRVYLRVPTREFRLEKSLKKGSLPIKSIMNAQLGEVFFEKIISGEIKAYKPGTNHIYSKEEIDSIQTSRTDTVFIENDWGDAEPYEVVEPYSSAELGPLKMKQKFSFDTKLWEIRSEPISITITIAVLDEFGHLRRNMDLFEFRF